MSTLFKYHVYREVKINENFIVLCRLKGTTILTVMTLFIIFNFIVKLKLHSYS